VLTSHRKQRILERLRQSGQIVAKDLSEELGLSEDTIRRDLRELAAEVTSLGRRFFGHLPRTLIDSNNSMSALAC
jgi:DeoR/GlpR family transcriptional regulator of sugar metabolism